MKKETHTVNLANVLDNSRTDQDPIIQANDVILVPSQGRSGSIFISGEVNRPGTIQLPSERKYMASEDILASGGFKDFADQRKVCTIRATPQDEQEITVDLKAVLDEGRLDRDVELQADDKPTTT